MPVASPAGRFVAVVTLMAGLGLTGCSGDEDPGRSGPGKADDTRPQPAAAVLHEPGTTWQLQADTVVPGGRFVPLTPVGDDEVPQPSGVVVGEVLVTAVAGQGPDAEPLLVGVSGAGKVLWRGQGYAGCWSPDAAALYCVRGEALVRVDAETGGAGPGAAVAVAPGSAPVLDDGVLYVVTKPPGADETAYPPPFTLSALDAATLKSVWPPDAGVAPLRGFGAGSPALDLNGDHVSVAAWKDSPDGQPDATQLELDRATGKLLGSTHLGKSSFLERPWTVHRGFGNDKLEVLLGDEVQLRLKGQPWDTQDDRIVSTEGRVGVGSTLYDATTGQPVWERADLGDELDGWRWTADRTQVAVTGYDAKAGTMATTYLDAATGTTQWTGPGTDTAPTETPDAFLQVATDHATSWAVQALDRRTGDVAWSKDVSELARAGYDDGIALGGPYVSPSAVWALAATTLVGYTGF
ncbi:PQQ-like beta-propeller repeat protein [Nocardioides daeguensis]|uniref:Pyrrolo-quinoline quinone n=1 Tax=Nocardioides daeguensis TaxID=908359 RepID=A0ABP6WB32_9ACTN|nr:PQQ-like beta-propeller repeat protein [Nocardioides daeguensis]MBV6729622.1 PQQ-like beta-propeller repeat protein [Nocardioides daeguensis]MCR1775054.1 PQQ-like beta-propeller repeat protein [Nocardioides daeguensis]